ncbi:MAG TPA: NifB/NifX family molybdenum-iron cluster-binding protein [Rhodocyclaceae bacterium]|nr:NifB/NifX family molybdenum-iron cluster-binding protein [Rhodocyclaceae bacterium]
MLKVAFASGDRNTIDQHFGAAEGFVIYALDAERAQLLEVIEFPPETMDGNENKLPAKVQTLAGCDAVYCLAAGASAVRQLLGAGIQPIRLDDAEPIEPVLGQLRKAIKDGGIPWVEKAVKKQSGDTDRFDKMAEEGWDE